MTEGSKVLLSELADPAKGETSAGLGSLPQVGRNITPILRDFNRIRRAVLGMRAGVAPNVRAVSNETRVARVR